MAGGMVHEETEGRRLAPAGEVAFSVLLTSRNEGEKLQRTVDDIFRSGPPGEVEVVIIDDASTDGSAAFVEGADYAGLPIRKLRNEVQRGLIFGRARGADLARGRYLVFLDAHCSVQEGWLEGLRREIDRIGGRGIAVPAIHKLRAADWTIDFEGGGAEGCTISNPFLDFEWARPLALEGLRATCTIGGGAWMCPRDWYGHIGGLDREMRVWGGENIDMPLRTWISGGWCVVAGDVKIGHLFNENPTNILSDEEFVYNKIRVAHNVFSRETFTRVMESLRYLQGFKEAIARIHAEREVLGVFKDFIEARRARPDSWLIETFRLPLLEAPFFYLAPRKRPKRGEGQRRPTVSITVRVEENEEETAALVRSLLGKSTYRNAEVLAVPSGPGALPRFLDAEPIRGHPRVRALAPGNGPLEEGALDNFAATLSEAEWLAFVPAGSDVLDESWMERFLLLAERRPRLLMAFPRTRLVDGAAGGGQPGEEVFDQVWDWDAPGFLRERRGAPIDKGPHQALSAPGGMLFVHRERFLDLGGFDPTVGGGERAVLDLAVRGWLSGHEVLCHPGIQFALRAPLAADDTRSSAGAWREYTGVLSALTAFSSAARLHRARERCPRAEPLIRRHAAHIRRRRKEQFARARFDDDWLFYKFEIEDPA